jgi:hypothetical protein
MLKHDPRLTDVTFLAVAAWRVQAKRRALGWEQGEGLASLLKAAETSAATDPAPPGRRTGGAGLQGLLAEARRAVKERDHGAA